MFVVSIFTLVLPADHLQTEGRKDLRRLYLTRFTLDCDRNFLGHDVPKVESITVLRFEQLAGHCCMQPCAVFYFMNT